jgi:hypothetical protein
MVVRSLLQRLIRPTVNVTLTYHVYVDQPIAADRVRALLDEHDAELVRMIEAAL